MLRRRLARAALLLFVTLIALSTSGCVRNVAQPPSSPAITAVAFGETGPNLSDADEAPPTAPPPTQPPTPLPPTTVPPTATLQPPTPTPLAVTRLEEVRHAIVQIESVGAFYDYARADYDVLAGRGSGFIIHPSGLAVTNNHVVQGAAYINVWVGEERQPHHATVLGVSECSDLALIDIDGDGYRYLEWDEYGAETGLPVFAAGFPHGEPTYVISRGIITHKGVDGDTYWASVDSVLAHDAEIAPGSSGGPLLNEAGEVVAINYAGRNDDSEYYAIAAYEALPIFLTLQKSQDLDSIGLNGFALTGLRKTGIAIQSVRAGSLADQAGLEGGQILLKINEFPLAMDGTMGDYCDILRTNRNNLAFNLEVYDERTGETFFTRLGQGVVSLPDPTPAPTSQPPSNREFITLIDQLNVLKVKVPADWTDVDISPWRRDDDNRIVGAAINASSNLAAMRETRGVPGLFFAASSQLASLYTPAELLDEQRGGQMGEYCRYMDREPYDDGYYEGFIDYYTDCNNSAIDAYVISALSDEPSAIILLINFVPASSEGRALHQTIQKSFFVIGTPP
ncbi:MAG: serine protease [Anaerolineales bacterium]|nr:serine protease [Anaerolineales bacterium]